MEFVSKVHGKINYEENQKITFKKGIPGFKGLKEFALIDLKEYEPFKLLHSLEDDEVGLILTSPFQVEENYEVKLGDDVIKSLDITSPEEVMVLNSVTLNSKVENITVNMKGPFIINIKNLNGEQIILDCEKYKTKHPLV
ncbi:MAG: flagellar assembly protein FliW [Clostridium sp.]